MQTIKILDRRREGPFVLVEITKGHKGLHALIMGGGKVGPQGTMAICENSYI